MKFRMFILLILGVLSFSAMADDDRGDFWNTQNCTGSKWTDSSGNSISIEDKFGPGTMAVTRCLSKTERVKVLYQINTFCKSSSDCDNPYAIGNIHNHIADFKATHGMSENDYEIVVIVHSAGWKMVLDNAVANKFHGAMSTLVNTPGVRVLFCQNTAHKKAVKLADMIDGIGFVTAGVSAISDLQSRGYRYVQP